MNRAKGRESANGKSDFDNTTVLHAIARFRSVDTIRLLVKARADVITIDRHRLTPLYKAI